MPLALAPAPPPARRCQYRQRDAFLSPLWRILVDHLETFVGIYDSRFVDTYGPLKPYAEKAFGSLLLCGDPNLGVTRFSCCACNIELAVPFSCKTRTCPSCAKRRAEEVAANLVERLPVVGVAVNFIWPPSVNIIWRRATAGGYTKFQEKSRELAG